MKLQIVAISGWAISAKWFHAEIQKHFPHAEIRVLTPLFPSDTLEAEQLLQANPADIYLGYSMGSLWLLKNQSFLPADARKVLIAPILAFARERQRGGKTSESQLNYLLQIMKREPDKQQPLLNFYDHCEIPFPKSFLDDVPDRETLVRGLEFLSTAAVEGDSAADFLTLLGENDVFVDAEELKCHIHHLHILKGVAHPPGKLLERAASLLAMETKS